MWDNVMWCDVLLDNISTSFSLPLFLTDFLEDGEIVMIKFGQVTPVSVRVDSKSNLLSKQNSANALTTAATGIVDTHYILL